MSVPRQGVLGTSPVRHKRVVFYDTSSLYKAGYYLTGFHQRQAMRGYKLAVRRKLPASLARAAGDEAWKYLLFSTLLFTLESAGNTIHFAIDTHDGNKLVNRNGSMAGYHLPLLETVDVYFKVNHSVSAIRQTPQLRVHEHKIHPIPPFIPARPPLVSPILCFPPPIMGGYSPHPPYEKLGFRLRERLRHLRYLMPLEDILAYRHGHKDTDVFFLSSCRPGERHARDMLVRYSIVKALRKRQDFRSLTGLTSPNVLPDNFSDVQTPRLKQKGYLQALARARIAVYTRGVDECISSRFLLLLGLGLCVVGQPILNNKENIYCYPHLAEQFCYENPDEILERVAALARNPVQAASLASRNLDTFQRAFSPLAAVDRVFAVLDDC